MSVAEKIHRFMDLALAKRAFLALAAGSFVLVPLDGLWVYIERPKPARAVSAAAERSSLPSEPETAYLSAFDRSTLFGAPSNPSSPVWQVSAAELIKDYRLKGVILGGGSEAIVEDVKTQRTLFVKTGSQLGDLTVKEIKEGQVILSFLGGEIKLEIQ